MCNLSNNRWQLNFPLCLLFGMYGDGGVKSAGALVNLQANYSVEKNTHIQWPSDCRHFTNCQRTWSVNTDCMRLLLKPKHTKLRMDCVTLFAHVGFVDTNNKRVVVAIIGMTIVVLPVHGDWVPWRKGIPCDKDNVGAVQQPSQKRKLTDRRHPFYIVHIDSTTEHNGFGISNVVSAIRTQSALHKRGQRKPIDSGSTHFYRYPINN